MNQKNGHFEYRLEHNIWRQARCEEREPFRDPDFWNTRVPEFTRHAQKGDYIGQFLKIMNPPPEWSVLDIGSAAGTLAVPMAPLVRRVTAMDPSSGMRELLKERCKSQGIDNIGIVDGKWEDDWDELGVGVHDVVLASRSLLVDDLRGSILKLQRHAAKRVYISTRVGDGPHDRNIFEAVGRPFPSEPDYNVVFNLLYQMGIYANVSFTVHRHEKSFVDIEDARNAMRWMIHAMTRDEEQKLRNYLARELVLENGCWKLPYPRVVRWAVFWWETRTASIEARLAE